MNHLHVVLIGLVGALIAAPTAEAQLPKELKGLDAYVESSMRTWDIPGLAIAVVRGDTLLYARGFGVKRLGDTARVGPETMFAIGSATKSFTALALGMLVDEGKIGWDDPVTTRLPGFALADPDATRHTTIRDLLSHRTGLPGENLVFWGSDVSRGELVRRIRYLPLRSAPRSTFEYQNLAFVAAGEVVPAVAGISWDDFVEQRIFRPIGMTRTTTHVASLSRFADVATPHAPVDGKMVPIPWLDLENAGPAGSIVASVSDMARYASLQLGRGKTRGRRLFSDSVSVQMHEGSTVIGAKEPYASLFSGARLLEYGLGWFRQDYMGDVLVSHGGQTDGMHANIALLPDANLGVVVLTNSLRVGLPHALTLRIIDAVRGRAPQDWSTIAQARLAALEGGASGGQSGGDGPRRVKGTTPTMSADEVVGRYRQDLYGEALVTRGEDGALTMRLLGREARLEHWHYDTYRAPWTSPMAAALVPFITFERNGDGRVVAIRVEPAGGIFDRVR